MTGIEYIMILEIEHPSYLDVTVIMYIMMHKVFQITNYLFDKFPSNIAVIWICMYKDLLIQALLRAQELGMTGDDYVWFLYTRHPDEVILNKAPWLQRSAVEKQQGIVLNLSEAAVAYRRQAFFHLKMVR